MAVDLTKPRRDFTPSMTARYGRPTFDPTRLVKFSPKHQHARLMNFPFRGSHFRPHMRSVVIAVHGGSLYNNRADENSRGAWGVFWGPGCTTNRLGSLNWDEPQTNNRAELEAVRQALLSVQDRRDQGDLEGWREIIIKLNSEYVKKVFDEYIWQWEKRGWEKTDGTTPEHLALIREIHAMICEIEEEGAVRFWKLDKEDIKDADDLVQSLHV